MNLQACQNCWFNGLQYGALGIAVGYCSRHKKILNAANLTTCGLQMRKDLVLTRALEVSKVHQDHFSPESIVRLIDQKPHDDDYSDSRKDIERLAREDIAEVVIDYGDLGSTIESLAQLRAMNGARAELARLTLSRAYVSNCLERDGKWTSGLHLYWWSRKKLAEEPEIRVDELRSVGATQLARQSVLTAWSLVMLRLTFIEDMTVHASKDNDPLGNIYSLTEQAATALDTFNMKRLLSWIRKEAIPQLDGALSHSRYKQLASELHQETS